MAALSASLKVTNSNQEIIYRTHLYWWNPYTLIKPPLFTMVPDNGYIDWVALLTLQQFIDLNREQIQQLTRDSLYEHKQQIEQLVASIRSGAWDDATIQVTIYEWESGLS